MKLSARALLAVLVISVGSLTPILPGQSFSTAEQQRTTWCPEMSMNRCDSCPINSGATSSAAASTCCTAMSGCLCLYLNHGDNFAANGDVIGAISFNDDRIATRSQRPPVPPPRIEFS